MLYTKNKLENGTIILSEFTGKNIFTKCPKCGIEHHIDLCELSDIIEDNEFRDIKVFCAECSTRRYKQRLKGKSHD